VMTPRSSCLGGESTPLRGANLRLNYEINNVTENTLGISWPPPSQAGLAMASATALLGHFWKAQVGQFWRAPTPKYGFHMSEQTNSIFADTSGPIMVTNSLKVFTVRSLPFHKRPGTAQIDLIHQGQIFVPFAALNLVHANGANRSQNAMLQPPGDQILHRVVDLIPGSAKLFGAFLPGKFARPMPQEMQVNLGRGAFPIPHGTSSTSTPQCLQLTRRMRYTRKTT